MFKKITIAIIGVSAFLCTATHAEGYYYGGSVAAIDYSESGFDDASLKAIVGRFGANFNENFSGEVRVGVGIGDDTVEVQFFDTVEDVDLELDTLAGVYVRGGAPVTEGFFPYAIVGFTRGELTLSGFGESESESDNDFSYGIGVDFDVSENFLVNLEYMNYFDKDDVSIDGFSIGLVGTF